MAAKIGVCYVGCGLDSCLVGRTSLITSDGCHRTLITGGVAAGQLFDTELHTARERSKRGKSSLIFVSTRVSWTPDSLAARPHKLLDLGVYVIGPTLIMAGDYRDAGGYIKEEEFTLAEKERRVIAPFIRHDWTQQCLIRNDRALFYALCQFSSTFQEIIK